MAVVVLRCHHHHHQTLRSRDDPEAVDVDRTAADAGKRAATWAIAGRSGAVRRAQSHCLCCDYGRRNDRHYYPIPSWVLQWVVVGPVDVRDCGRAGVVPSVVAVGTADRMAIAPPTRRAPSSAAPENRPELDTSYPVVRPTDGAGVVVVVAAAVAYDGDGVLAQAFVQIHRESVPCTAGKHLDKDGHRSVGVAALAFPGRCNSQERHRALRPIWPAVHS